MPITCGAMPAFEIAVLAFFGAPVLAVALFVSASAIERWVRRQQATASTAVAAE